jgi:hypothetical protein
MINRVKLTASDDAYVVTLPVFEINVIRESLRLIPELQISSARMLVQFGFEKSELKELGERLDPWVTTGAELPVTHRDLRMIYLVLWQVPEMFGTEEAFHIRLGFFTEQARGLARTLLTALDRIA